MEVNDKTTIEKSSILLRLFLEELKPTKVINGVQLVELTDISVDKFQCSLYEEYRKLIHLKHYMTSEAFDSLKKIISKYKNTIQYICALCDTDLLDDKSISCDSCLK